MIEDLADRANHECLVKDQELYDDPGTMERVYVCGVCHRERERIEWRFFVELPPKSS